MKILIVDDAPVSLKLLGAQLEGESLEVVEASDGIQALAILEHTEVDAIVSDILMPRMDGYRLCQEVRKNERWGRIPFIFYTATYIAPEDEKLCYDLGGDKYLHKPAPVSSLLAALVNAAQASRIPASSRTQLPSEFEIMKEYSQRLVAKLEEKNQELEQAQAALEAANRELESRVQQRTAELSVANHELESFSYSVSHDLRAPLRHIDGYIDLFLRNHASQFDDIKLKHLHTVRNSARSMGELIDALLELSRVTRVEIHRRRVDLSALAAEVFAELQQNDPARVVKIEITPRMIAHGDPPLLRVALMNLLGNAWKYTRKQPDARIEFGKMAVAGVETYFVRDNGAGFDMAYVGKLFGAFQRLHFKEDFEGLGIGLATVQRIIQKHHGKIGAESIDYQGATFYFTLGEGDATSQPAAISD